jgi:hypothetical protein
LFVAIGRQGNNPVRWLSTWPHGFERTTAFALDEASALIAERVREALEG